MNKEDFERMAMLKDASTFPLWELEIRTLFEAKDIWDIVDGTITKASTEMDPKKLKEWRTKDALARRYILATCDLSVKNHVLRCETGKEMYDQLNSAFNKDSSQQKTRLWSEFYNFKINKNQDILSNISNLQNITFRLNRMDEKISDEMMIQRIISALPEEYRYFSSAWDSSATDQKTLENLKSRLGTEEERIKKNTDEDKVAFNTGYGGKKKGNTIKFFKGVFCHNCKKEGHFRNRCPKPRKEDNQDHKTNDKINKEVAYSPCQYCKKTNHLSEKCFWKNQHEAKKRDNNTKVAYLTYSSVSDEDKYALFSSSDCTFVADTGATEHFVKEASFLSNTKKIEEIDVGVAKEGEKLVSNLSGEISSQDVVLTNVLHLPGVSRNLLSINTVTKKGGIAIFDDNSVKIVHDGKIQIVDGTVVLEGTKTKQGLWEIDMKSQNCGQALLTQQEKFIKWHNKLGHINFSDLKKIPDLCDGIDADIKKCQVEDICEYCVMSKKTRKPFCPERARATRPLEIIHADLCGKISPATFDNEEYILTIMDDYTHFLKVYLLHTKNEAEIYIKEYVLEAEAHFNLKTERFRCDRGGEFRSCEFKLWCKNRGLVIEYTINDTPQQNGKAERVNLTLMNKVRAMLYSSKLDNKFWGFAVQTAAYLLNRSVTRTVEVTPYEMWNKRRPDLSRLEEFGQIVYTKNLGYLKKLDPRSDKGIFIGYSTHGYRVWNTTNRRVYISRDVEFTNKFEVFEESDTIILQDIHIENENPEDEDYVDNSVHQEIDLEDTDFDEPGQETYQRRQRRFPRHFEEYEVPEDFLPRHHAFLTVEEVDMTYAQCMISDEKKNWQKAIDEEKNSIKKNHVWVLVDAEKVEKKKIITSRWVFKKKDNGMHKARLVARGCQQEKDSLDFAEMYSSVVQTTTLRILLTIAAKENFEIITFDVKTAFLNGELDTEIFMEVPEGYNEPGKVCLLKKALYGLRQAPQKWNQRLTDFLRLQGLIPLKTDQCVFRNEDKNLFIAIHVDDGLVIGKNRERINELLKKLKTEFEVTLQEEPRSYLGMELKRTQDGIYLFQEKYVQKIVSKYGMKDSKKMDTPIAIQGNCNDTIKNWKFQYNEVVGSLLFLTCKTRPDIAFAVNYESRALNNPMSQDFDNVKRTLRYLNGDPGSGILFPSNGNYTVQAYSDSDYAGCVKTRKSTTGYVILFGGAPISWCSRKQKIVALSTTEAEYIAAAQCVKEMKFLKTVIQELTNSNIEITLNVDNQSAIKMIKSGQLSRNSKHIEVRYHFIADEMKQGWFDLKYCPTDDQLADIFTKPLLNVKFASLKKMLMRKPEEECFQ